MTQDANYWINRPKNDREKDWRYDEKTWLEGYVKSVGHPHRKLIVNALKDIPFDSLLEIGCNTGPNLVKINKTFAGKSLAGIDVIKEALSVAKKLLPEATFKRSHYEKIPFKDKSFDVVLADATLLYADPKIISKVMFEIDRVVKNAVILVERYAPSLMGEEVGHCWGRNYAALLQALDFKVKEIPITKKDWPFSKSWPQFGRVWIATR